MNNRAPYAQQVAATQNSQPTKGGLFMRTLQVSCPVGVWVQVLPPNPARQFLQLWADSGDAGPVAALMGFNQNENLAVRISGFDPRIAPINAIYVLIKDTAGNGSTKANVYIVEG